MTGSERKAAGVPSEWAMKLSWNLAPTDYGRYDEQDRADTALNIAAALDAARAEERTAIVQWLRNNGARVISRGEPDAVCTHVEKAADAVERGAHVPSTPTPRAP